MDQRLLQGWHADPFGLHEWRYFSAGGPTKLVRDAGAEFYDEPPAPELWTAPAPPAAWAEQSVTAPGDPAVLDRAAAPPDPGPVAPRRRTGLVYTAVALTAAAAVVGFVAVVGPGSTGGSHGPDGADMAAFVTTSARQTLAEKTASITLTGAFDFGGTAVDLQGNGQLNLIANTGSFNLNASVSGGSFAEDEIFTSQAVYLKLTVDGQSIARYLGGRHWLEAPLARSPTRIAPQDNPAWSLQLLEQKGGRVVPLGAQSVGGLRCDAYAVTPSRRATLAAVQQEWAEEGLSGSEIAAAQHVLARSAPPTITVWLDPARQLTCQLAVSMQLSTGSSAGSGGVPGTDGVPLLMTFTRYGVPVTIATPAPADTYRLSG